MIDHLPVKQAPAWLMDISANKASFPPIKDILADSLYYPSSAFDGDPIAYLSGNFYSFIYVDYGHSKRELAEKLDNTGFLGYHMIQSIEIIDIVMAIDAYTSSFPPEGEQNSPNKYLDWIEPPFAKWIVFQRDNGLDDQHGAERFSLLYICSEAVATFHSLYLSNHCSPLAVAIIQPGHAFGRNWTNFTDPTQIFARTVLNNPYGQPKYVLYGGQGGIDKYQKTCWPEYSNKLCFLGNTSTGIWQSNL